MSISLIPAPVQSPATVAIGGSVTKLLLSGKGDRVYVVHGAEIAAMCTATREIIDTVAAVAEPTCSTESQHGKRI